MELAAVDGGRWGGRGSKDDAFGEELRGYELKLRALAHPQSSQWRVAWSDQFRFGHFTAGHTGWIQTLGGPVTAVDDAIPRQQAAAAFGNPTNFSFVVDEPLLQRLFRAWRQCYLRRKNRVVLLRLFRALEVAFHASPFPADGLTSVNDVGTRIALWVSAFEVLCHPGGRVNKRHVQRVISDAPFADAEVTSNRTCLPLRSPYACDNFCSLTDRDFAAVCPKGLRMLPVSVFASDVVRRYERFHRVIGDRAPAILR